MTKGIILAGGTGSRLAPITLGVSKQLLPIYDKPLVYYPLSILMMSGIREVLVITNPQHLSAMKETLGTGESLGIHIYYEVQLQPRGLADAFIVGEKFIGNDDVVLVLGDNIFYGQGLGQSLSQMTKPVGANILATKVSDPENYGIVEIDDHGVPVSIHEKPMSPRSNLAVPGLYFYDNSVIALAKQVLPSKRGELEITAINQMYLKDSKLKVTILPRGTVWMDTGTVEAINSASTFIRIIEERQNLKIACIEEIAWRQNWISSEQLIQVAEKYENSPYSGYLHSLLES